MLRPTNVSKGKPFEQAGGGRGDEYMQILDDERLLSACVKQLAAASVSSERIGAASADIGGAASESKIILRMTVICHLER